jgi:hypothetical protein
MDIGETIATRIKRWPLSRQRLLARIVDAMDPVEKADPPPLRGLWAGFSVDITDDLDDIRREMWSDFPREDV